MGTVSTLWGKIPMPGDSMGSNTVVASVWLRDEEDDEACLVLLLTPEAPFYKVVELEWNRLSGSWTLIDEESFPNINPAVEAFAAAGGDY